MNVTRTSTRVGFEHAMRKIASDNDHALMKQASKIARLSREVGQLKERERALRMEIAELRIENERLLGERNDAVLMATGTDGGEPN